MTGDKDTAKAAANAESAKNILGIRFPFFRGETKRALSAPAQPSFSTSQLLDLLRNTDKKRQPCRRFLRLFCARWETVDYAIKRTLCDRSARSLFDVNSFNLRLCKHAIALRMVPEATRAVVRTDDRLTLPWPSGTEMK